VAVSPHRELLLLPATRYLVPLREGGTLPAVVETEEGGLWVVKFRGAGQGARALLAEILVGELARGLGLPMPELALVEVPEALGRTERDPEIQDLLQASRGVNVGIRYLEGAFNFDPRAAGHLITPALATQLVWFDALTFNPDRSPRNPNLMIHEGRPWLIDHGAALYPHFDWSRVDTERSQAPSPRLQEHVLLPMAEGLATVDTTLTEALLGGVLESALAKLPDVLLADPLLEGEFESTEAHRGRYRTFLLERLQGARPWVAEAEALRRRAGEAPPQPLESRR
jgi:hypothetical protein